MEDDTGVGCSWDKIFPSKYELGESLDLAKRVITKERQSAYGNPEDSFQLIASYWNTYLAAAHGDTPRELTLLDIAHMMILLKMGRVLGQAPSRDSYIDIQGYAAIAADRLFEQTYRESEEEKKEDL